MKYHCKVHKEGNGFWAECLELSGCFTQADFMIGLRQNVQETLNLYTEEPVNPKKLAAPPDGSIHSSRIILEVQLDPSIAFSFMVRYHRIQSGLAQQEAACKLGFENIYSYQRLENKKCDPALKVLYQIKKTFRDFSVDFSLSC